MKSFKEILNEKTYSLDRDVHYLYKKAKLDKFIEAIQKEDSKTTYDMLNKNIVEMGVIVFYNGDSSELTNRDAKTAHKKNPINIRLGVFAQGSYYNPKDSFLQVSVNSQALQLLQTKNSSFKEVEDMIHQQVKRFRNEFTEANIKGSIYHELTHWIDDSIHNRHISRKIDREDLKGGRADVNHTEFEVNSQIHKIKQLKKSSRRNEFDDFSWEDLMVKLPSLMSNFKNFRSEDEYYSFTKEFLKRMDREKVRPKNLKKILSWRDMKKLLSKI